MDGDWTCPCGRANPATRAKCPACGETRGAVAANPAAASPVAAAPRPSARLARVDEVTPVPPNPPGAEPFAWATRSLAVTLPKVCACCLGPPARQPFELYATKHEPTRSRG